MFILKISIPQGLQMYPVAINTSDYVVAADEIIAGAYDTWLTYGIPTAERLESFLYATPFGLERYGVLVKRDDAAVEVNFNGLMAGINFTVFCTFFAAVVSLITIGMINERREYILN